MEVFLDLLVQTAPVFTRCFGMLLLIPVGVVFSYSIFIKIGLSTALSIMFVPELNLSALAGLDRFIGELLLGVLISFPFVITVSFASMCGDVFDTARGQSIADMYDPINGTSSSYSATLLKYFVLMNLFCMGFFSFAIGVMYRSFELLPIASLQSLSSHGYGLLLFVSSALQGLMAILLPFALVFVLVDIAAAFLGKVFPQGHFFAESMLLKTCLGYVLLIVMFRLAPQRFYELAGTSILPRLV